jgi:hypothetical protein
MHPPKSLFARQTENGLRWCSIPKPLEALIHDLGDIMDLSDERKERKNDQ